MSARLAPPIAALQTMRVSIQRRASAIMKDRVVLRLPGVAVDHAVQFLNPESEAVSANNDQNFVKTVFGVIVALVALTVVILIVATLLSGKEPVDTAAVQKLESRLNPIGHEITDPEEFKKLTAVAPHAPLSGAQVVAQVCTACHSAGVLGAPKIGDKAAWSARKVADGGVEGLAASAEKGKNSMPARGGRADLSDDEIKGAVQEMLKQTGV